MTPQKYIIYTDWSNTQSDIKKISDAFQNFLDSKQSGVIILPKTCRIELFPERPQPGRAKRKNRNI